MKNSLLPLRGAGGVAVLLGLLAGPAAFAQVEPIQPPAGDPSAHAFPALGATATRRVSVEWNRFYDHAGLGAILARLHQAFPDLTRLYSVGKSVEGRDLWCLEVSAFKVGDAARKPGMYIDGNIHGNEVQGGEVVAYTAWYLLHQYGRLESVTDLLDRQVFYLIPTINPDGRDRWFHRAQTASTSRSGAKPQDDDRDGRVDEDDYDDLDGDGSITEMRVRDPQGRWKADPDYPEYLMVPAKEDEPGEFTLLGGEGLDNDGDGLVDEDPVGGYDMNRNWAWDWQPNYIQRGAREYPFSLPETRALASFVSDRPNIAAFQSYHNAGGMILRSPGREGGVIRGGDDRVLQWIAQRGESQVPHYRSMVIYKDLYTVWGGEIDWLYGARGILGFSSELWTPRNLYHGTNPPTAQESAAFVRYLLLNEGLTRWKPFNHPTFGPVEIGGMSKAWGRVPPSFMIEEECHRNMAFTLYHAAQVPRLAITEVKVEPVAEGLSRVKVTVANSRLIPTRSEQDVSNHISPPDVVSLAGEGLKVISAGRIRDRFRPTVTPVERRPERVELDRVPGMGAAQVQFLVTGKGAFTVTVDSAKGGLLNARGEL